MSTQARCAPRERWPLRVQVRALVLGCALLASGCATTAPRMDAYAGPNSFAPLVKRVLPAVVNIVVTEPAGGDDTAEQLAPDLQGPPGESEPGESSDKRQEPMLGAGTGFIVDPSGVIVTNNHVVQHADKIVVSLADGRQLPAKVLGTDELTDVAVLKVDARWPLPHVAWGDSRRVEVGDWILAAGNPFGLGDSVSAGIVSAEGRDLGASPLDNFLQIDAPINPGNSGGPIFAMNGKVIGVSTAIVSPSGGSVGIGFAIPSDTVRRIVAELLVHGTIARGWLGVAVQDAPEGVQVAGVEPNGPALRAGVKPGDVILAVDKEPIDSARSLIRAVAAMPPGTHVHLTVRRQGHEIDLPITIGRRPPDTPG